MLGRGKRGNGLGKGGTEKPWMKGMGEREGTKLIIYTLCIVPTAIRPNLELGNFIYFIFICFSPSNTTSSAIDVLCIFATYFIILKMCRGKGGSGLGKGGTEKP